MIFCCHAGLFKDDPNLDKKSLLVNFLNRKYSKNENYMRKLIRFLCDAHNRVLEESFTSTDDRLALLDIQLYYCLKPAFQGIYCNQLILLTMVKILSSASESQQL